MEDFEMVTVVPTNALREIADDLHGIGRRLTNPRGDEKFTQGGEAGRSILDIMDELMRLIEERTHL